MNRPRFLQSHPLFRLTWPLYAFVLVSIPFAVTDLDLRISGLFYDTHDHAWRWADAPVVTFIYDYATWLTWGAVYVAFVVLIAGLYVRPERSWRRPALFFVLAVLMGPGILVNGYGKGELGRPRPRQVESFGGDFAFQRLGYFDVGGEGSSFPSGHASMGFVWIAPAYYYRARRPRWSRRFLGLAVVHGGILGLARMAAGGHFASDVLWSAGANFGAAILLSLVFGLVAAARGHDDEYARDVLGVDPDRARAA